MAHDLIFYIKKKKKILRREKIEGEERQLEL